MRGLAWFLFVTGILHFLDNLHDSVTTKSSTVAAEKFWKSIFTIPTIIFFILYLF